MLHELEHPWKFRHSLFNIVCFKIQIPYWKLKFKYKYHGSYQEAIKHENIWKRYEPRKMD